MAINVPLNAQLQNATQLQQQIQNAVNSVRINLGGQNGARALSSLSQPLGRLTGQADEFTKSLDAANARVLAFGASVGVVNAVTNAFKSLVNSTIEVEKAITAISIVGDKFTGKTKELGQGLFKIAKETGQSFSEVSKAALEFSRQGLLLEDTLSRTQDALVLTRLTGLDAAKSVDGLTAAFNAFSKAGLSTTQIVNKLAAVDQAFAVSSADLIEGFNRSAAVAQNAGVTFDELAGIITALQQETSRGGAVIGNALKTIFTRLQDTSTLNNLQNLGVAVQDLQGNILPARQILQNLATDVEGLSQITKAGIFKDVAGTFQINQLISLVGDLNKENSIAAKATLESAGATNQAYVANEKLNQSLDAILNKVANTGKQLGSILGELGLTDNLKGLLDGINSFLDGASSLLQGDDLGSNFAKGFVKGIGAVLSGPGLGIFLAIIGKLSLDLAKFGAQSLKAFFGIGKAAADQKLVQESIVQTLLKNQSVLSTILNTQGGQNAQALKFLGLLNQQATAMQAIQGLAGGIASTVYSGGFRATAGGLQRKAAGGYLPAQEASDVRRGVGGASPSSKVVSIPNFAFGGGKRGTMIANTSEYIVPNYAGGGSAIFNQDMVKSMGLPAGAKKISAAGGFVPNFADQIKDVSNKYALIVNETIGTQPIIASHKSKDGDRIDYKANAYGIDLSKLKNPTAYSKKFSQEALVKKYQNFAQRDAARFADTAIGRPISPVSVQKLANAGSIPSLVGTIFESAIESIIQDPEYLNAFKSGGQNALFDFVNAGEVNDFFGIPRGVKYVEAKYRASGDALKSFGSKIYKEEVFGASTAGVARQKFLSGKPLVIRQSNFANQLQRVSGKNFQANNLTSDQISLLKKAGGILTSSSASGYIPNFAAAALQQAIAREKSAGLSNSQIYVDQNSSLKSSMNPMGLMVANRRDEPAGGFQGIARARKEGVNPKLYGAANGFVPNYVSGTGIAQSYGLQQAQPSSDKINKSFADAAGKIFLLQSAVSFLTGAVGDSESSFAKLAQQVGSTIGNLTSLGLLGQQIAQTNPAGNFGKFMKGLGLAGIGFAAVTEGFKLFDFAIKEFSGENEKAALASAKLADASDKLSVKFESLSKTRQTELGTQASEILGSAGFRDTLSLFTGSVKGGGDIGGNIDVQKNTAELLALGASRNDISKIIESSKKYADATDELGNVFSVDVTELSDILKGLETAKSSGLGKTLDTQFKSFQTALGGLDLSKREDKISAYTKASEIYGARFGPLPKEKQQLIEGEIKRQEELNKQKQEEQKAQNDINFGERLSLEIAKKRVDSVLEIAKLQIQATNEEEAQIQLQEQTLELSNRQKIVNEARLKQLDLEKKKQTDIVDSIGAAIDKAQQGGLSVSEDKLKALQNFLGNIDFSKVTDANFDGLANQLAGTYLDGNVKQAEIIIKSVKEEQKEREKLNAETGKQIDAEKTRKLQIDGINQSLASQLSTIERIASTAASIGNLNISGIDLQNAQTKAQITRLQAQLQDPNLTEGQKNAINTQINGLEKINNLREKDKAAQEKQNQVEQIRLKIAKQSQDVINIQNAIAAKNGDNDAANLEKLKAAQAEFENLQRELQIVDNTYASTTVTLDANNAALETQALLIGKVTGAYASYQQQLEAFRLGAGGRVGSAMLDELGATDINSLMQARIKQNVEADASGLNDKDRYKTVQEETRLRQIQFDLATAESVTRKRELEYELKYTKELIDLKNQGATEQELIDARNRQISEQRSGGRGFEKGLDAIQDRINNYRTTLGEEIPNLFSSNLSQGLNDAISGAKDLKTALTDAATSFFQEITKRNISNLADIVTGGLGKGTSSGGGILSSIFSYFGGGSKTTGLASGGFIKGGSGTKDDVPAMLMGGEYVVKKSAVSKYGKGFLDAINSGNMRGYATGGMVDPQTFPTQTGSGGFFTPGDYGQGAITGKNELLTFASQSFTGGQYDYMGGFGMGGATVSLEPESARLSALGREGSPMFERVQQSKDEAFRVYLEGLQKEKEYSALLDQIAKDKKARKKQLQMSIISAVASSALNAVGSVGMTGAKNAVAAASKAADIGGKTLGAGAKFMAGAKGFFTGSGGQGGLANIFKGTGTQLSDLVIANQNAKIMQALQGSVQGQAKTKSLASTQEQAVISKKLAEMYSNVNVGTQGIARATAYGNKDIDLDTAAEIKSGKIKDAWQYLGNTGAKLQPGKSVASNVFKTGTILKIGKKEYIVQDIGGMGPNIIDFYAGSNKKQYQEFANMGDAPFTIQSGGLKSQKALKKLFGGDMNSFRKFQNMFGVSRAAGGLISGGSNVRDDVPAMLTGGEFVLNNRATQRLGVQNLNKLNSGSSISSEGTAPSEVTQALMSKLDELIEATQGSSQSSVVVNVSSTDQQEENPADMNERDKELQKKIRQAVLDVIAQEKRLGGSLEKSR